MKKKVVKKKRIKKALPEDKTVNELQKIEAQVNEVQTNTNKTIDYVINRINELYSTISFTDVKIEKFYYGLKALAIVIGVLFTLGSLFLLFIPNEKEKINTVTPTVIQPITKSNQIVVTYNLPYTTYNVTFKKYYNWNIIKKIEVIDEEDYLLVEPVGHSKRYIENIANPEVSIEYKSLNITDNVKGQYKLNKYPWFKSQFRTAEAIVAAYEKTKKTNVLEKDLLEIAKKMKQNK
jgi:hypothetical protein